VHYAAKNGLLDILDYLIRLYPEYLNLVDGHNQTPLIHAANNGWLDCVDYLCKKECDLNTFAITRWKMRLPPIKLKQGKQLYIGQSKMVILQSFKIA